MFAVRSISLITDISFPLLLEEVATDLVAQNSANKSSYGSGGKTAKVFLLGSSQGVGQAEPCLEALGKVPSSKFFSC